MITIDRQEFVARPVADYARRVVEDLQLYEPPISIHSVLDYFGLDVYYFDGVVPPNLVADTNLELPAFLKRDDNGARIYLKEDGNLGRERLSILHECGHFDIPWHAKENFLCDCSTLRTEKLQFLERQAFDYALEILFPAAALHEDLNDEELSLERIEFLAQKYGASFEATANRCVKMHPGRYAVLYLVPYSNAEFSRYGAVVRYSMKSRSFDKFLKPGTLIERCELLARSALHRQAETGEIQASALGSSRKHVYRAEARPFGQGQLFLLISSPDSQTSMFWSM